jgi:hypothetical protein
VSSRKGFTLLHVTLYPVPQGRIHGPKQSYQIAVYETGGLATRGVAMGNSLDRQKSYSMEDSPVCSVSIPSRHMERVPIFWSLSSCHRYSRHQPSLPPLAFASRSSLYVTNDPGFTYGVKPFSTCAVVSSQIVFCLADRVVFLFKLL